MVGVALSEGDYCNATLSLKKGGLIGGWSLVGVALSEGDYCNATFSLKKGGLNRRELILAGVKKIKRFCMKNIHVHVYRALS